MGQRISLSRPYFDTQKLEAVRRVLDSGWVMQGPEVETFEAEPSVTVVVGDPARAIRSVC